MCLALSMLEEGGDLMCRMFSRLEEGGLEHLLDSFYVQGILGCFVCDQKVFAEVDAVFAVFVEFLKVLGAVFLVL